MEFHLELPLDRIGIPAEVISLGVMIGTSISFPNLKYKDPLYHYFVIGVFLTSFLVYNARQWKVVTRYLLPALVMVVTPVGVLYFQTDIQLAFFLDRIPLLAMFISLTVTELDRYVERESLIQYLLRRPAPVGRPRQPTDDLTLPRIPDIKARSDTQENDPIKTLVAFMQDIEQGASHPFSERSSDISMGSDGLESLPQSWDSLTKRFFRDGQTQEDQSTDEDNQDRMSV